MYFILNPLQKIIPIPLLMFTSSYNGCITDNYKFSHIRIKICTSYLLGLFKVVNQVHYLFVENNKKQVYIGLKVYN